MLFFYWYTSHFNFLVSPSVANHLQSSNNKSESWWVRVYFISYSLKDLHSFHLPQPVNVSVCLCMLMFVRSFGLAADQKRSRYKERGRSMNSTGSGKSSTVSRSVRLVRPLRSGSRSFSPGREGQRHRGLASNGSWWLEPNPVSVMTSLISSWLFSALWNRG